jgi:hypothetical protein
MPQTVDLSAGLKPKPGAQPAPAPAAAPTSNPVDLSAGMVQKDVTQDAPAQPEPSGMDQLHDTLDKWVPSMNDMYLGFAKGAGDTAHGIGSLLNKIPMVGESLSPKQGLDAMDQMDEAHGVMQHLGKGAEAVMEFMGGDEAIKGLSMVEKLQHMQKVAQFMKAYPKLGAILAHGITNFGLGSAQSFVKDANPETDIGDTAEQAAGEGAAGAGFGAAVEGAGQFVKGVVNKIKPGSTNIAGVEIPKLASQEPGADPLARKVASIGSEPEFSAAQQQGSAKAIKNTASLAAENAIEKISPGAGAKARGVSTFGEAADKVRAEAQPYYAKLDQDTNGQFSALNRERAAGYRAKDFDRVHEAEDGIEKIFKSKRSSLSPDELKNARQAFSTSYVLDDVHDAVNRSFNISDEAVANKAGVWRGVNGGKLMTRLNNLVERTGRAKVEGAISSEGLTNLYRIADLTQTPQNAAKYGNTVNDIAMEMLPKRGLVGATIDETRKFVLHSAATNPRVGKMIEDAIKVGANPKMYAPLIARAINGVGPKQQITGE